MNISQPRRVPHHLGRQIRKNVPYSTVVATIVQVVDTIHHSFRRRQGQKADKDIVSWLGGSPSP
jgi:hypothetical protein